MRTVLAIQTLSILRGNRKVLLFNIEVIISVSNPRTKATIQSVIFMWKSTFPKEGPQGFSVRLHRIDKCPKRSLKLSRCHKKKLKNRGNSSQNKKCLAPCPRGTHFYDLRIATFFAKPSPISFWLNFSPAPAVPINS